MVHEIWLIFNIRGYKVIRPLLFVYACPLIEMPHIPADPWILQVLKKVEGTEDLLLLYC